MGDESHIAIPAYCVSGSVINWITIDMCVADTYWQDRGLGFYRDLKQGFAEFSYGLSIGTGSLRKEYHIKAVLERTGKIIDLLGKRGVFFTVGIQASTQAGNISQERIFPHFYGSDIDKWMDGGENDNIGVGNVICNNQMVVFLQYPESFRIVDVESDSKSLQKMPGSSAGIFAQHPSPTVWIPIKQLDNSSYQEEFRHQIQMPQQSQKPFHSSNQLFILRV